MPRGKDAKQSLQATASKLKTKGAAVEAQMKALEKLQGPEDFFKFLSASGLSPEEIQQSMSDPSRAGDLLDRTLNQKLGVSEEKEEETEKFLSKIDRLHDICVKNAPLRKDELETASEPRKQGPAPPPPRPLRPSAPQLKTATYRLKLGRSQTVALVYCELTKGMRGVTLDVSQSNVVLGLPGYNKLNIVLPQPIDPDRTKAKFSRKAQELRITMPLASAGEGEATRN